MACMAACLGVLWVRAHICYNHATLVELFLASMTCSYRQRTRGVFASARAAAHHVRSWFSAVMAGSMPPI